MGFGHGPHRCQAENLSRVELEVVLGMHILSSHFRLLGKSEAMVIACAGTLFKKLPDLKLAVPVEKLQFTPATQNVGIMEFPVTW